MVGSVCVFPVTSNVDTISASVYPFLGNVCLYLFPFFLSHHFFFLLVLLARTVEKAVHFCLLPLRPGLRRAGASSVGNLQAAQVCTLGALRVW